MQTAVRGSKPPGARCDPIWNGIAFQTAHPAILRRARRTAAILHWRQAGASMAVIARGLGIGIGTVHRTLRELRSHATRKDTDA